MALRHRGMALGIIVAVLAAVAALDDITTDNSSDFTVEYWLLIACGLWLCAVSFRLWRHGHRILGSLSCGAVAAAAWALSVLPPHFRAGVYPEYLAILAALVWFTVLAAGLFRRGWNAYPGRPPSDAAATTPL